MYTVTWVNSLTRLRYFGYCAKQLTEDMVERATLILVAEAEHADWIIPRMAAVHHKVHLIKQVANLK